MDDGERTWALAEDEFGARAEGRLRFHRRDVPAGSARPESNVSFMACGT